LAIRLVASMRAFVMPVPMNARICGHQAAEFFLGDPGGQQLAGGFLAEDLLPHAVELLAGEPFAGTRWITPP
jgi:hypothetical protein